MYLRSIEDPAKVERLRRATEPATARYGYEPDYTITVDGEPCPVYQPEDNRSYEWAVRIGSTWYRFGYAAWHSTHAPASDWTKHRGDTR